MGQGNHYSGSGEPPLFKCCKPGTDVMIFKNIFAKKIGEKNWRFWLETLPNSVKGGSYRRFLRKTPVFCIKLAKIAENCDHNIGPCK
jgi:hypothetical protein